MTYESIKNKLLTIKNNNITDYRFKFHTKYPSILNS